MPDEVQFHRGGMLTAKKMPGFPEKKRQPEKKISVYAYKYIYIYIHIYVYSFCLCIMYIDMVVIMPEGRHIGMISCKSPELNDRITSLLCRCQLQTTLQHF